MAIFVLLHKVDEVWKFILPTGTHAKLHGTLEFVRGSMSRGIDVSGYVTSIATNTTTLRFESFELCPVANI